MKISFPLVLALIWFTGCSSVPIINSYDGQWPPVLRSGEEGKIRDTAVADARADIAAGRPRVAFTGGFFSDAAGIPLEDVDLVKRLPNVPLPCGCTAPLLGPARTYAEAYNKEILQYLLNHKPQN